MCLGFDCSYSCVQAMHPFVTIRHLVGKRRTIMGEVRLFQSDTRHCIFYDGKWLCNSVAYVQAGLPRSIEESDKYSIERFVLCNHNVMLWNKPAQEVLLSFCSMSKTMVSKSVEGGWTQNFKNQNSETMQNDMCVFRRLESSKLPIHPARFRLLDSSE